jgi:hypothetical protein
MPLVVRRTGLADAGRRRRAVEGLATHGAADDELVAAPAMVGAVSVGAECASEVAGSDGGDLLRDAELDGRGMEGASASLTRANSPG